MLYITKSISNKLYLKKQLYGLRMTEVGVVLEHLNFFNRVVNEFLTTDEKIDKEDKALILLSSLSKSCDRYHHALRQENSHLKGGHVNSFI